MQGLHPGAFNGPQLAGIRNLTLQKAAYSNRHRQEGQQIAKRHQRWSVAPVSLVLLRRSMPEPDLFLIVEPGAIMGPRGDIDNPLHEPSLHPHLVFLVRVAVRRKEPLRKMRLST